MSRLLPRYTTVSAGDAGPALKYDDAIRELGELSARAAVLEAQLAAYKQAIESATERHPQNNVVQALARISARNSELAIRPTHHNRRT